MSFAILVCECLVFIIQSPDLVSISTIILAKFSVQVIQFLQNLLSLLFQNVIFSSELIDSSLNLVELIGQLSNLTC